MLLQAINIIPSMNARGMGVMLTGFAHMNFRHAQPSFLAAILKRINETMQDFSPMTFGNVVWSLHVIAQSSAQARQCVPVLQQVGRTDLAWTHD